MLKTNIKKFIVIAMLLLCSGCASFQGSKFTPEKFAEGQKGVVFISLIENEISLYFEIKNAKTGNKYSIASNQGFFHGTGGGPLYTSKNMLFLDPGIYYIDCVELLTTVNNIGIIDRSLPSPGLEESGIVKYGAFEVKPAQVSYIGNLIYSPRGFAEVLDYELLRKQLSTNLKYQILLDKVQPVTFYGAGSIIYHNENGNTEIIDQNKAQELRSKILKKTLSI
jgi:hypothetical protein